MFVWVYNLPPNVTSDCIARMFPDVDDVLMFADGLKSGEPSLYRFRVAAARFRGVLECSGTSLFFFASAPPPRAPNTKKTSLGVLETGAGRRGNA